MAEDTLIHSDLMQMLKESFDKRELEAMNTKKVFNLLVRVYELGHLHGVHLGEPLM